MRHASVNPTSAQTNAALIAAKSGRFVVVDGVYVSSAVALTVSLVNSATHDVVWRQYVGANGGSLVAAANLVHSKSGEGLDLTTSTDGGVFISVMYHYSDE